MWQMGQSHLPRECPAWGKKCHKCGNKNHFTMCCETRNRKDSQDRDQHRSTHRESWNRRSRSRHSRYASEDLEDRSRSRSTTWSTHSIEFNSFQDHPEFHEKLSSNVHERLSNDLHGRLSFQDPEESTNYLTKTFHAISRSKSVASISNETNLDGKQRSSQSWTSSYHTEKALTMWESKLMIVQRLTSYL